MLTLETGMGSVAAEAVLEWMLAKPMLGNLAYRPKCVIAAGFAGALREEQRVGDVILATEVRTASGECWPTTWPGELPPGEWRPPLHRGRLLCAEQLIGDPETKRKLGIEHEALAVDMESAAVARLCQKQGIAFGCVRAISDAVHTPLSPELAKLLSAGRVSPLRLLLLLARRPRIAGELWGLRAKQPHRRRATQKGARRVAHADTRMGQGPLNQDRCEWHISETVFAATHGGRPWAWLVCGGHGDFRGA